MAVSTVGPWAKDKLDRLGKYLHAYTTIFSRQPWCRGYFYIDAFAGPGTQELRRRERDDEDIGQMLLQISEYGRNQKEQREFLAGSPRVALELEKPFTAYFFVEKSAEREAELARLSEEHKG